MKQDTLIGVARWIRTIGHLAGWILLVAIGAAVAAWHLGHTPAPWVRPYILVALAALTTTIPLAEVWSFLPGETWLERYVRRRRQDQMRQDVFELSMTPEEHVSSLPASDRVARLRAARELGIPGDGT